MRNFWCTLVLVAVATTLTIGEGATNSSDLEVEDFVYTMEDPCFQTFNEANIQDCNKFVDGRINSSLVSMCDSFRTGATRRKRALFLPAAAAAFVSGMFALVAALANGNSNDDVTLTQEDIKRISNLDLQWNDRISLARKKFAERGIKDIDVNKFGRKIVDLELIALLSYVYEASKSFEEGKNNRVLTEKIKTLYGINTNETVIALDCKMTNKNQIVMKLARPGRHSNN